MGDKRNKLVKSKGVIKDLIRDFEAWLADRLSNRASGKCLYLFIARKAQHIYFSLSDETKQRIDWCTEISLPFIDLTQYDEVVIVDDAIYYGSTFQKIQKLLLMCCLNQGCDISTLSIVSFPLALAKGARNICCYQGFEKTGQILYLAEINEATSPYYINSFIDKIAASRRPYDIEAPIFKIKLSRNNFNEQEVAERISKCLSKRYGKDFTYYSTTRYNQTEGREFASYSIVLDNMFDDPFLIKPDFAKFRIIIDLENKDLRISSYCINAIDDWGDNKTSSFFQSLFGAAGLEDVFKHWYHSFESFEIEQLQRHPLFANEKKEGNTGAWLQSALTRDLKEYVHKSWAVLINFFFSYFLFGKIFPLIKGAFVNNALSLWEMLDKEALYGLAGPQFMPWIERVLKSSSYDILQPHYPLAESYSIDWYPKNLKKGFLSEYQKWVDRISFSKFRASDTIAYAESQSLLFSAMHTNVEMPSRSDDAPSITRLNFGESYPSLRYKQFLIDTSRNEDQINVLVHKAVDSRIDAGSVVPHYVLTQGENSLVSAWSRQFRCGENDDMYLGQPLRNLFFIVKELERGLKGNLYQSDVNFILCVLNYYFSNDDGSVSSSKGFEAIFNFDAKKPKLTDTVLGYAPIFSHEGREIDIIDYAEDLGLLKKNAFGEIDFSYTPYCKELTSGNLLDADQERLVKKFIHTTSPLLRKYSSFGPRRRELLNWLFPPEEEDIKSDIKVWSHNFLSSNPKDENIRSLLREKFYQAISHVPMVGVEYSDLKEQWWVETAALRRTERIFSPWRDVFDRIHLAILIRDIYYDDTPRSEDLFFLESVLKEINDSDSLKNFLTNQGFNLKEKGSAELADTIRQLEPLKIGTLTQNLISGI